MQRATKATRGLGVQLAWEGPAYDPSPVSSSTSQAYRVIAELAAGDERIPVAPGPGHGHHRQSSHGRCGRGRVPLPADRGLIGELQMIHGTNEHMTRDNLRRTAEF